MIALTVCQPWAWAIVSGPKDVENRSWPTRHRGRLLIHAGTSPAWATDEAFALLRPHGCPGAPLLVRGHIVGVCDVIECVSLNMVARFWPHAIDFASGPHCWCLANRRAFRNPVPCAGRQRLWAVEPELSDAIEHEILTSVPAIDLRCARNTAGRTA